MAVELPLHVQLTSANCCKLLQYHVWVDPLQCTYVFGALSSEAMGIVVSPLVGLMEQQVSYYINNIVHTKILGVTA